MKHLLNDLTEQEKNSIREQHTGSMKVVTENFSRLINAKSGSVKSYLKEENDFDNYGFSDEESFLEEYKNADEYAFDLYMNIDNDVTNLISYSLSNVLDEINDIVIEYQNDFKEKYGQFANNEEGLYNESIDDLMKMSLKSF